MTMFQFYWVIFGLLCQYKLWHPGPPNTGFQTWSLSSCYGSQNWLSCDFWWCRCWLWMMIASMIMSQIPPLANMVLHHPGTFDSCLEVVAILRFWSYQGSLTNPHRIKIITKVKSENLTGQYCLLTSYYRTSSFFDAAHRRYNTTHRKAKTSWY